MAISVCRADSWVANGLHTIQWTAEACLAAIRLISPGFWCGLASYGAPSSALRGACALSTVTGARRVVSDGKMGPAGYTIDT